MTDPRPALGIADLERLLADCRDELAYPPTPDVTSRLRARVRGQVAAPPAADLAAAPLPPSSPRAGAGARPPLDARQTRRWWLREWTKLAAAMLVFALVGALLVAVFRDRDGGEMTQVGGSPMLASPTTLATAGPTNAAGRPIVLPAGIASRNAAGDPVRLVGVAGSPKITQEQAMRAVDAPWALGGTWEGQPVTLQAWYGLVTAGRRDGDNFAGVSNIPLPDGTTLEHIENREAWLLDYGNVPGISAAGCPDCPPPPVYNHDFYIVDAATGAVLYVSSYSDSMPPATPAPTAAVAPLPAAWFPFGELPAGFRLRTADEARAWALNAAQAGDAQVSVVSVVPGTLRDKHIEDARNGAGPAPTRDPDDTPMWRVEYAGAAIAIPNMCAADASCQPPGEVVWFRASDGQYDSVRGYDPATAPPMPTPRPAANVALAADPAQPLYPGAEVVHIVMTTAGPRPIQGPGAAQGPITTEIWLDRVHHDALVRETRANGELESLTLKRGATLTRYLAEGYDGATGAPSFTLIQLDALAPDHPALRVATPQLDWYREALASGHAVVVGAGQRGGRPALEVQVAPATPFAHVAWLDRATLLPLEVSVDAPGWPQVNGVFEQMTYATVEALSAAALPADVFSPAFPGADSTPRHISDRALSADAAGAFTAYPLWDAGAAFADFALVGAARHVEQGDGTQQDDATTFTYRLGPTWADEFTIVCRGPLSDSERHSVEEGRGGRSEQVNISGVAAWVVEPIYRDGSGAWVELERPDGFVTVRAPNRDGALAVAAALQRVNGR